MMTRGDPLQRLPAPDDVAAAGRALLEAGDRVGAIFAVGVSGAADRAALERAGARSDQPGVQRRLIVGLERPPFDCLPRQALRTGLLPLVEISVPAKR